ncbi:hydroxymethylglutaryl-CoA reductase [Enterobacter mori]|uniref:hydroxymethylglutaryl-CoA reductase n=1 Tax=Enterobacter mori TaxID=539813 RepID=UPI001B8B9723|nr:hydroxymethylglutaryl-CoA reductase [Enterobacter mori]MBS3046410.1 3-hydroxy-3-methylglutaryl-CoA reductase [Enterobacter mori]
MSEPETDEEWVSALVQGRKGLHQLPATISLKHAATLRRQAMALRYGVNLQACGEYTLDEAGAHCENMIGATQVPLGVAGPLILRGKYGDEAPRYIPLATTEGALIASVSRGCQALSAVGGVTVHVEDPGITRAPVLRTRGIEHSQQTVSWIDAHREEIRQLCEQGSRFLKLQEILPGMVGSSLYLRFRFTCGDAMGMNMATLACERVIHQLIEPATGAICISISGNVCTDKKSAAINFIHGRGKRIFAEAEIDKETLLSTLKTQADALCEVQYRKNLLGSAMARSSGFNAHHANIIAAFYLACGQDIAQVAESADGITCVEDRGNGAIYASIMLPDTPLATVGGGTSLATQREALALMGIIPGERPTGEDTMRLAEMLGGAVLAGELSLLSAQASHHLGRAHQQLGRS